MSPFPLSSATLASVFLLAGIKTTLAMIEPVCFHEVCGQTCYNPLAAECIGGTTCQLQHPLPEDIQSLVDLGAISDLDQYCPSPTNSCNGILFDEDVQSCVGGAVVSNTDGFFCGMSSSVWCTSGQACNPNRDDQCLDLDDLCASDKTTVCTFDHYTILMESGGLGSFSLDFICGIDCNEKYTNSGEKTEDGTTSASALVYNCVKVALLVFAATAAQFAAM